MKIVVTGANGFIGSWLIKELLGNTDNMVFALVRAGSGQSSLQKNPRLRVIEVDYKEKDAVKDVLYGKDVLIHLIGQMGGHGVPEAVYWNVNVELTKEILRICNETGIRQFIFCSTPGVQGFGHRLAEEETEYAPRNAYEKTKVCAEEFITRFCGDHTEIKYTIIRPDFVYGPGDVRRVKMYRSIKKKKFVLTTNGKSYLHPTYITDIVQGFIKTIGNENAYNQVFNLSAAQDVTSLEFMKTIAECVDSKLLHINIGYRLSEMAAGLVEWTYEKLLHKEPFVSKNKIDFLALDHSTSSKKAQKMIGYAPQVSLREGMRQTIEWCRENGFLD